MTEEDLKSELEMLLPDILTAESFLAGSIRKRSISCGNKNCKCMDKVNPVKHSCYHLGYTFRGKARGLTVRKGDVELAEQMAQAYRRRRDADMEIGRLMAEAAKQIGFEQSERIYSAVYDNALRKLAGTKPESVKLKRATERLESWKAKAIARVAEINVMRVKIRDLESSRDKWKAKFMALRQETETLERESAAKDAEMKKQQKQLAEIKKKTPNLGKSSSSTKPPVASSSR